MASRCAARRSSTAAWTDLATEPATAVSSGSGTGTGGAASAVRRRRTAERRTQSTAQRWVIVASQRRHDPRAGSNACGSLHTRTNTSWVMSWAAALSRVNRTASPVHQRRELVVQLPQRRLVTGHKAFANLVVPPRMRGLQLAHPGCSFGFRSGHRPPQLPKWCERQCQVATPVSSRRARAHPAHRRFGGGLRGDAGGGPMADVCQVWSRLWSFQVGRPLRSVPRLILLRRLTRSARRRICVSSGEAVWPRRSVVQARSLAAKASSLRPCSSSTSCRWKRVRSSSMEKPASGRRPSGGRQSV